MKPRLYFITLVVASVPAAVAFYRDGLGLGLASQGPFEAEPAHARFEVQPGLSLVLSSEAQFQAFSGLDTAGKRASQVILSLPFASRAAVVQAYGNAIRAGGISCREPAETEWGFAAMVQDLDGNLVELVEDDDLPELVEP